jgi:hypothetical protein
MVDLTFDRLPSELIIQCCFWLDAESVRTVVFRTSKKLLNLSMALHIESLTIASDLNIAFGPHTEYIEYFVIKPCFGVIPKWVFQFPKLSSLSFMGSSISNNVLSLELTGLPRQLTSLDLSGCFIQSNVTEYLPDSLTSLTFGPMEVSDKNIISRLPKGLICLKKIDLRYFPTNKLDFPDTLTLLDATATERCDDAQLSNLPDSLRHLSLLMTNDDDRDNNYYTSAGLRNLPRSITHLDIPACHGPLCIFSLPRGLKHLKTRHCNMTATEWNCLPLGLNHLDLSCTNFDVEGMHASECHYPPSITSLTYLKTMNCPIALYRNLPSALRSLTTDKPPDFLQMCPLLPNLIELRVITPYDLYGDDRRHDIFSNMPQLKSLELNSRRGNFASSLHLVPRNLDKISLNYDLKTRQSANIMLK